MLDQAVNIALIGLAVVILVAVVAGPKLKSLFAGASLPTMPALPSLVAPDFSRFSSARDSQLEQAGFSAIQTLDHVLAHSGVAAADRKQKLDPILALVMCHKEPAADLTAKVTK